MIGENFRQVVLPFGFDLSALALNAKTFSSRGRAGLRDLAVNFDRAQAAAVEFDGFGCVALNDLAIAPDTGQANFPVRNR